MLKKKINVKNVFCTSRKIHWILAVTFIILLCGINPMISYYISDDDIQIATKRYEICNNVQYDFDLTHTLQNLKEDIYMWGWAFCENDTNFSNKEHKIILSSSKRQYVIETATQTRSDVRDVFKDKFKICGDNHGFGKTFSTIGIKDGVYDILIYCKENDDIEGVCDTGYRLTKRGREVLVEKVMQPEYDGDNKKVLERIDDSLFDGKCDTLMAVDNTQISDGLLNIEGWAFCETDEDNSGKTMKLIIKSKEVQYGADAQIVARADVYDAFKSEKKIKGINHGFKCVCDFSKVKDGEYALYVYCKENENISGSTFLRRNIIIKDGEIKRIK